MPKVDQATHEGRKGRVFLALRRYPAGLSEAELEQITRIQRRTLNNYLRALEMEGKVYKDGITWAALPYDQVQLRKFDLSPEEAMTLYLATRLLVKQHDKRNESAESALMKLAAVLTADAGVGNEIHQAALELAHRPEDSHYHRIFRMVMQAYIFRKVLHITYEPLNARPFETDFAPYLLEPSAIGFTTYAIGHSNKVNGLRTYKLDRIREAALTRQDYHIPSDFPGLDILRSAWSVIYGEQLITVTLRFSPAVRKRVLETRWHPSEETTNDPDKPGHLRWTARVADTTDMLPWVKGWGADCEVLEPEGLREVLVRETRQLARLYSIATAEQNSPLTRLLRCWGKTGRTVDDFHPAVFHMLDVGHVARELLSQQASPRWRRVLTEALGAEADSLADWLPWLMALHDIGKLSEAFQEQNEAQKARMVAEGFVFSRGWNGEPRHSEVGQAFLSGEMDVSFLPDRLQQAFSDMIGGHHGRFAAPDTPKNTRKRLMAYEAAEWADLRRAAASALKDHLLANAPEIWPEPTNVSAASMALTGFTILCDWLGSDGAYFSPRPEATLNEYVPASAERARRAVEAAGFFQSTQSDAPIDFSALFPDRRPARPLQVAIDDVPAQMLTEPCLAIIEAPTGEGKTEAALALAHRLAQASGTEELYYALPTAATSNQMFGRLQEHLYGRLDLTTQARLIHSQAFLVEDDLRMEPLGNGERQTDSPALEWFGPKKRALLAPFGVGTVDQAELAALNVPHAALRMMGLAGKVVIVDEVHAYDTYMTTIVERLLNWLAQLGASVILLSATLPVTKRAALARAFGVGGGADGEGDLAYPRLWVGNRNGEVHEARPDAYQPDRRLMVERSHFHDGEEEEKARWLLEAVKEGGCACWIANTVSRAQRLFRAVDRLAPSEVDRLLLHARFPLDERQKREQWLKEKYGPDGAKRPQRGIVIGTQVLEQSLDLDFDVMVSDPAPMDFLLQRAGRLHRHDRPRPAAHALPRLWINTELDNDSQPLLGVDAHVYDEFILRQTWQSLIGREVINLPADYRPLVEAVYGVQSAPDGSLAEAWKNLQDKESDAMGKANTRLLPAPNPEDSFTSAASRLTFDEDENSAAWFVAQTRLGEESINVIPLETGEETVRFEVEGVTVEVRLNSAAPRDTQLQLLRRNLRISNREVVQAIREMSAEKLPRLFTESALLKGYFPLWLESGCATMKSGKATLTLRLDPDLGLVIDRKKGQ